MKAGGLNLRLALVERITGVHVMDDETAEWYVEKYGEHPTNRMTVEFAGLKSDDVVLDIGCGSGTAVREAASAIPEGRVIGIEPTPAMIRIAREQTEDFIYKGRIEFIEGYAERLPVPDASVTIVFAINSIHHWESLEKGLSEIRRVLRTDGRFFVTEEEIGKGSFGHGEKPLSNPDRVAGIIENAGFSDVVISKKRKYGTKMILITARRQ
jgi:SAM-dependent methyltransferase